MTTDTQPATGTDSEQVSTSPQSTPADTPSRALQAPDVAAYWAERRRYLERIRKVPEVRQRYWKALGIYLLRRALWSFGFFPPAASAEPAAPPSFFGRGQAGAMCPFSPQL